MADRTKSSALLGGGTILTLAMLVANGGNYALNIFLGRWLAPAQFADANLMVTIMFVMMALAVALQIITSRAVSIHQARGTDIDGLAIAAWLNKRALVAGIAMAIAIAAPASLWSRLLQTESTLPFLVFALGVPAFLGQALRRGVLQGQLAFVPLATSYVCEMVVRTSLALLLVHLGYGATGATVGLTVSFMTTWLLLRWLQPLDGSERPSSIELDSLYAYVGPVLVLLIGQILINNGDVLIVKSSFRPEDAGIYSAIALIGRGVFFLSWSAVTTLFPAATQRKESGSGSSDILFAGIAVVAGFGLALTGLAAAFGDRLFRSVFGPEFGDVQTLLVLYALTTTIFATANLLATYQLSLGRSREARLLLGGALLQTLLLVVGHGSASEVVSMQLIAMSLTLVVIGVSAAIPHRLVEQATSAIVDQPSVVITRSAKATTPAMANQEEESAA